jgi:hypothetical protein
MVKALSKQQNSAVKAKSMASGKSKREKVAACRHRAALLENSAEIQAANRGMKAYPEVAQTLIDGLKQRGAFLDEDDERAMPSILDGDPDGAEGDDLIAPMPRSETNVCMLHKDFLMECMFAIHPAAWSPRNLKALKPHASVVIQKEPMLQLIEFDSGVHPHVFIGTDDPIKENTNFRDALVKLSEVGGGLGRYVPLGYPIDWPRFG